MDAVPDLTESLRVLTTFAEVPEAPWGGPRCWWGGPMDVEGLAIASVRAAAAALNALTGTSRYSVSSARVAASFDSLGNLRINGHKPEGVAPLSGFRKTMDGWIRLHANYPHHAARLLEGLRVPGPEYVDRALQGMTSLEAESAIVSARGVASAVRTRQAWVQSPMHGFAAEGPWIRFSLAGQDSAPAWSPAADAFQPLRGLRVLDLTRVIAGPVATRLLGALGADVIRIDPPDLPELRDAFIDCGFNKRSAVLDFRTADGLDTVRRLVEGADVVVAGYRDGALARFGLDPRQLLLERPGLVVAGLNAWGGGPWRERRGFDSLVQAACGIASTYGRTGDGGWKPGALPVQALDHATGYGLAAAILGVLAERLSSGRGGLARLSLARTAEELQGFAAPAGAVPQPAETPDLESMDSSHGRLRFVGPPLLADGVALTYTEPPVRYGSSRALWRGSRGTH